MEVLIHYFPVSLLKKNPFLAKFLFLLNVNQIVLIDSIKSKYNTCPSFDQYVDASRIVEVIGKLVRFKYASCSILKNRGHFLEYGYNCSALLIQLHKTQQKSKQSDNSPTELPLEVSMAD